MSEYDGRMQKLERELRNGDESARVMLTFLRIRSETGYIVTWEGSVEGAPVCWVYTGDGQNVVTLGGARAAAPVQLAQLRRRKRHALAVLDLEDFTTVCRRIMVGTGSRKLTPGSGFSLVELRSMSEISGCYPRSLGCKIKRISLEPPARSPLRRQRTSLS